MADYNEASGRKKPNERKSVLFRILSERVAYIFALLALVLLVYIFNLQFLEKPPHIDSIDPRIAGAGDVLVIRGNHFGQMEKGDNGIGRPYESEVRIAGARSRTTDYIEWTRKSIKIVLPEGVDSGMVYVVKKDFVSNGVLFTNRKEIPIVKSGQLDFGAPHINKISSEKGSVGDLLVIQGHDFGISRGDDGRVSFSVDLYHISSEGNEAPVKKEMFFCSEYDFDYESWTDNEISVHVPDGAASGNIKVVTDRGLSNGVYFNVNNELGKKRIKDPRSYQIEYGVEVDKVAAQKENTLCLWLPGIYEGCTQRNIENSLNPDDVLARVYNISLFQLKNLESGKKYAINQKYRFSAYSISTAAKPYKTSWNYDKKGKLFISYTEENPLVPVNDELIKKVYRSRIPAARDPYTKARFIYNYIKTLRLKPRLNNRDVVKNLRKKVGDPYTYSILFCAFARNAEIPARPVAGFLVYGDKQVVRHYWAEFYIKGFGWVPVDPALGNGLMYENLPIVKNPGVFYFGNMDNQHISFSKGVIKIPSIDMGGKSMRLDNMYSLQTIHEESSGDLSFYAAHWSDINITDWW